MSAIWSKPLNGPAPSNRIAILLHDLRGGGAERVSLNLARGMLDAGRDVDLVLVKVEGDYRGSIPKGVRIIDLGKSNVFKAVPALVRYIRRERPRAILSALTHVNVVLLLAKLVARGRALIAVAEHNQISLKATAGSGFRRRLVYRLMPVLYRFADEIIAVSKGVAADVEAFAGLPAGKVRCIYNPSFDPKILEAAPEEVNHPWLRDDGPPVLLAVGRLHEQKGFDVLLEALALARQQMPMRLIIMGEGGERPRLEALRSRLGLDNAVSLAGFVGNPYAMMARARLLVVSSRWEGLPTVIIEALGCGLPVVSTDCPSGPREILDGGRYGALVPPEDPRALATAIVEALGAPRWADRSRAEHFSTATATANYLAVLER